MIIADVLGIEKAIQKLLISMVGGIYKLVGYAYQIFLTLAETNIFSQSEYQFLVEKVYTVLGVLVMFVIAYNILTFIVDPDKNKSGAEVEKMVKKIFISFILIVLCPLIFSYAFKIQNAILKQNTIANFFNKTGSPSGAVNIRSGGHLMAGSVFEAFFVSTDDKGDGIMSQDNCIPYWKDRTCSLSEAKCAVKAGVPASGEISVDSETGMCKMDSSYEATAGYSYGGKYRVFKAFAGNIIESQIDFAWLMSLIAGGYLLYVIVSFCFDLAVRVIKLAFYQIIAPICIACQIIPKKESIFTNWWKAVTKTYISVFIRVFIMNLGVYLISILTSRRDAFWSALGEKGETSAGVKLLAFAFLVLGIITFMKQASKLIDEIFGLGDVKLGIKDKLKEGTSPITNFADKTARLGFGAAGIVRGFQHGHGNPLAAIRAARTNYQNRNLSGNEAELLRRREFEQKLSQGATRGQLFADYLRNKLGMPSTQTVADRRIDDMEEINDGNAYRYQVKTGEDGRKYLVIEDVSGNEVKGSRVEYDDARDRDKINKAVEGIYEKLVDSDGKEWLIVVDPTGHEIAGTRIAYDEERDAKKIGEAFNGRFNLKYAIAEDKVTGEIKLYIQDSTGRSIKEVAVVTDENRAEMEALDGQQVAFNTKFKDSLELEHQSNDEQINAYNDSIRRINANLSADAKLFQLQKEADDQAESELRKGEEKTADITGRISGLIRNEFSVSYADDFVVDYSTGFSIEIERPDLIAGGKKVEKINIPSGDFATVEAAVNAQLARTDLSEAEKKNLQLPRNQLWLVVALKTCKLKLTLL